MGLQTLSTEYFFPILHFFPFLNSVGTVLKKKEKCHFFVAPQRALTYIIGMSLFSLKKAGKYFLAK